MSCENISQPLPIQATGAWFILIVDLYAGFTKHVRQHFSPDTYSADKYQYGWM